MGISKMNSYGVDSQVNKVEEDEATFQSGVVAEKCKRRRH